MSSNFESSFYKNLTLRDNQWYQSFSLYYSLSIGIFLMVVPFTIFCKLCKFVTRTWLNLVRSVKLCAFAHIFCLCTHFFLKCTAIYTKCVHLGYIDPVFFILELQQTKIPKHCTNSYLQDSNKVQKFV
jgi:hypothetical protein